MKRVINTLILILICSGVSYLYGYQKGSQTNTVQNDTPTDQSPITESISVPETPVVETVPDSVGGGALIDASEINEDGNIVHHIKKGETLFTIGLQYDVLWTTIAAANNIDENTPLIEGASIIIPITKSGNLTEEETLSFDDSQVSTIQAHVDNGKYLWRKDPVATVREETPTEYHLKNDDTYTLSSLDTVAGKAVVEVSHDNQSITIELLQPNVKGDNGVWFISNIKRRYNSTNE